MKIQFHNFAIMFKLDWLQRVLECSEYSHYYPHCRHSITSCIIPIALLLKVFGFSFNINYKWLLSSCDSWVTKLLKRCGWTGAMVISKGRWQWQWIMSGITCKLPICWWRVSYIWLVYMPHIDISRLYIKFICLFVLLRWDLTNRGADGRVFGTLG